MGKGSPYDCLPARATSDRPALAGIIADALRRSIVDLEFKPGDVIDRTEICTRLGVSLYPVAEALRRLRREGLVDIQPRRPSTVALMRIEDVLEAILIRRALESEASAICASTRDSSLIRTLMEDMRSLRSALEEESPAMVHAADKALHQHIVGHLDLPQFRAAVEVTGSILTRTQRLVRPGLPDRRIVAEHAAIVEAIEAREPAVAASAMRTHLGGSVDDLLSFAAAHPEYFSHGDAGAVHCLGPAASALKSLIEAPHGRVATP